MLVGGKDNNKMLQKKCYIKKQFFIYLYKMHLDGKQIMFLTSAWLCSKIGKIDDLLIHLKVLETWEASFFVKMNECNFIFSSKLKINKKKKKETGMVVDKLIYCILCNRFLFQGEKNDKRRK